MILIVAVVAGLLAGVGFAGRYQTRYEVPVFRGLWLVFIAFAPQFVILYLPVREVISDRLFAILLVLSQTLFLGFAFLNRNLPGMKILLVGTALNWLVIIANGGFMPISPETASRLVPENILADIQSGGRFGAKDVLLSVDQTRLEWLADRFLPPAWVPYQVAFSLGDVFIAAGAFWLLAKQENKKVITHDRSNYVSTVRQS
jgi:hypothetical protein